MSTTFRIEAQFPPAGDQPRAIEQLVEGLQAGEAGMTLLRVTGSGKTYTIANVIQQLQRPTLIMAHNKTLAAQLYGEMKEFFPHNAVEYFVSYYDYYQPEAYVPSSDTFIEKDASINEHIEQMRLSATKSLLERRDAIIVATVSAIYGLGDPQSYLGMVLHLVRGDTIDQRYVLRRLAELQYTRNDIELHRATYRVRGEVIDVFPAESDREAVRIELFDEEIESLSYFDPLTGEILRVSMDMSPAYEKGVKETCRHAQVVFDKFHVVAHANQAEDEVRRAEVRLGGAGVWEALHKSRWLWRKNPENLSQQEVARLATIDQKSLRTAKAYQMRLVLQDIYRSATASVAQQRFRVWCRWVRWVAKKQPKNLLRSMVKVANLVERHLAGILAHWRWGVTNAFMEGLNSVFSATKRKARGYRSTTHLITMLYFVAGKLRLPQF